MDFRVEQLTAFGVTAAGLILIFLLGISGFFVIRRGLKKLSDLDYISNPVATIINNILRWLIIIAVIVICLQYLGINVSGIITGLLTVAGMIAIGFIAVWSVMSNIFCAGFLILFNLFEINDEIEVMEPVGGGGLKGKVVDFNLMFTTLEEKIDQEADNNTILTQIPNNIFFQKSLRRRKGPDAKGLGQHLLSKPLVLSLKRIKTTEPSAEQ